MGLGLSAGRASLREGDDDETACSDLWSRRTVTAARKAWADAGRDGACCRRYELRRVASVFSAGMSCRRSGGISVGSSTRSHAICRETSRFLTGEHGSQVLSLGCRANATASMGAFPAAGRFREEPLSAWPFGLASEVRRGAFHGAIRSRLSRDATGLQWREQEPLDSDATLLAKAVSFRDAHPSGWRLRSSREDFCCPTLWPCMAALREGFLAVAFWLERMFVSASSGSDGFGWPDLAAAARSGENLVKPSSRLPTHSPWGRAGRTRCGFPFLKGSSIDAGAGNDVGSYRRTELPTFFLQNG